MEFKAIKTRWFGDTMLVIYDWMKFSNYQRIHNLYAYDREGGRLWIAEQRHPGDFFVGFVGDGSKMQAATWEGFCCTLDPTTGKIVEAVFTK